MPFSALSVLIGSVLLVGSVLGLAITLTHDHAAGVFASACVFVMALLFLMAGVL